MTKEEKREAILNAVFTPLSDTRFVVRMPGASYAYHFHRNTVGFMAQAVADRDATIFKDRNEAEQAAIKHGLRQFEIHETPTTT